MFKKFLLGFVFASLSCLEPALAYATDPPPVKDNAVTVTPTVDAPDLAKVQEQIKSLQAVLDANTSDKTEKKDDGNKKSTTAADVADKALDMLGGMAGTAANLLKNTAPEIWRIMIRQQYAEATMSIFPFFLLLSGSIFLILLAKKVLKLEPPDSKGYTSSTVDDANVWRIVGQVVTYALSCLMFILFVCNASSAIGRLINPEYYALNDLVQMFLKK